MGNFSRGNRNISINHRGPNTHHTWFTSHAVSGKLMFTQGLKSLECIPPTQHALFQHTKRALLIAGYIWKQSLVRDPEIPNASEWGWEWNLRTNTWVPYWTDLQDASRGCTLLLHCGCVVACKGNCKCNRAGMRCGLLCKCEGGCTNNLYDWHMHCLFADIFSKPFRMYVCVFQHVLVKIVVCDYFSLVFKK